MKFLPAIAFVIASAIALAPNGSHAAGDGELYIDPQSSYVMPGQDFEVDVVTVPPDETLGAWVIEIQFDSDVIFFTGCDSLQLGPPFIDVTACDVKDTGGSPDGDTAVTVGAALNTQTGDGIASTVVLATIGFEAVGPLGASTPLHFNVIDFLAPVVNAPSLNPETTDGYVEITNDPPPTPGPPTPTPSPTPSPTPIPIGGTVVLITASKPSSSSMPATAAVASFLAIGAFAAFRLTRRPPS